MLVQAPQQTTDQIAVIMKDLKRQLRAAQQEVKDYEVYKEVMETAVGKMQVSAGVFTHPRALVRATPHAVHGKHARPCLRRWWVVWWCAGGDAPTGR